MAALYEATHDLHASLDLTETLNRVIEIGVESEPGKGSTFWFTLPIAMDQR